MPKTKMAKGGGPTSPSSDTVRGETPSAKPSPKKALSDGGVPTETRQLTSDVDGQMARRMRDGQWAVMERVAALSPQPLWICWWNKDRHHSPCPSAQYSDGSGFRDDLLVCGLIDGMELAEWLNSHKDWWIIGEWSDERYAAPVTLTEAGRSALANREQYDMEPVTGGLVEPGWQAIPAALAKARGESDGG